MKKIIKKFLLFVLIFVTFTGGAFASSKLSDSKEIDKELIAELRGAIRFLSAYHTTGKKKELQDEAREFIDSVLADEEFRDHVLLAFDDVDGEHIRNYNKALASGDQLKIRAMENSINHGKSVRKQFGL